MRGLVSGLATIVMAISVAGAAAPESTVSAVEPSSIRWKEHVQPIRDALAKTLRLRGVFFDWKKEYGGHHDIGFIAEEVGRVVPEVVEWETPGNDAVGVKYERLTPLLVEAIRDVNSIAQRNLTRLDEHQVTITDQGAQLTSHDRQITSNTETLDLHEQDLQDLVDQMGELTDRLEQLETENEARMVEIDNLRQQVQQLEANCQPQQPGAPAPPR
jgi:DNA repair exonuclease SbcCD ATPase subunit